MKRDEYKDLPKGYYHLSTDGKWKGIIFHTPELYAYGMILMGLVTLHYAVDIYAFTLMENHIHIVLSGTGFDCREVFHYLVKRLNARLRREGYPELPEGYSCKLVPIESPEQLANDIIYLDRNPYEKQYCVPTGYPWGTTLIHHSRMTSLFKWTKAKDMSKRALEEITGSRTPVPGHWEFNPVMGLNPASFVRNAKFQELFPSPKSYLSKLTKDYEACVHVAERVDEEIVFSSEETNGILNELLRIHFSGRKVIHLNSAEKGRLAVMLAQNYHLPTATIGKLIGLQEYLVKQFLNSKDYGKGR